MFTKRPLPFLWSQLILAGLLVFILVIGDRSQPNIISVSKDVRVNEPIVVTFDRPVKREGIDELVVVSRQGQRVEGEYSWSSRSIAFIPSQPLEHDAEYQLLVGEVRDLEDHPMREPYTGVVRTSQPRFMYISADSRLHIHNLVTQESTLLTESGKRVVDYAVSAAGTEVLYSYTLNGDSGVKYGLMYAKIKPGGSIPEQRQLYEGGEKSFGDVEICNNGLQGIAYVYQSASDDQALVTNIAAYDFLEGGVTEKTLSLGEGEVTGKGLFCAETSDQFMYRTLQGDVVLSALSDTTQRTVLGRYLYTYGFAPSGEGVILGTTSPRLPSPREVFFISSSGVRRQISSNDVDTSQPAYSPDRQVLAVVEDVPKMGGGYFISSYAQVVLYKDQLGQGTLRKVMSVVSEGYSDQRPAWSRDAGYVSYERVRIDDDSQTRIQDADGSFGDGDIQLLRFDRSKSFLIDTPQPVKTGVKGSRVTWLP